jgi:flagellar hook-associated protein 2
MTTISSTASNGTGSISSPGVGSGLDVNSIVSQLVALEKQPLQGLQTTASNLNTQLSAYGSLQADISSLNDAATALADPKSWTASAAVSSNAGAVNATVSGSPSVGVYSVQVQQLASAQSVASAAPFAATNSAVGTGSLTIQLGTWNTGNTNFTAAAASSPVTVTIGAADNSLSSIAAKINAAGAGVTASVVQDVNGARIVMTSNTTGAAAGFRIQANDDDLNNTNASGLSSLAYDPAAGANGLSATQSAANAKATVNGLAVESASNTMAQGISGLSIQLSQVTTTPVSINVSSDATAMTATIQKFVSAYNNLNADLGADLKYDASTKTGGPLQGDRTAVSIQRAVRSMLSSTGSASASFSNLSSLGLQFQSDGSLKVNSTSLTAALTNPSEISKFFSATNLNSAASGFGVRLASFASGMLTINGSITNKTAALNNSIKRNTADQQTVTDHAAQVETRLRKQYTALDANMAKLNALNSYITQQVTGWNNQKN